jgi:hypothetical protein
LLFKLISRQVKGHRDDERDYVDLTRPEQLNVLADHCGTAALNDLPAAGNITSREKRTLRTELPEYELRACLQKRNDWSDEVYDSINWPTYRSATAQFTTSVQAFVVKVSHGWLPIGEHERRCSATTDLCPQCNEIETVPHLYRCQVRAAWRHRFLIHLQGHLEDIHAAADICCIILAGIQIWFLTGDTNDPDSNDPILQSAGSKFSKAVEDTARGILPEQGEKVKILQGGQWTKLLIAFLWAHSRTLERSVCSCTCTWRQRPRQIQRQLSTGSTTTSGKAYAHAPSMLAHDRRILDLPLEEQIQSRTSDLAKTMRSVINQSIRDAGAQ